MWFYKNALTQKLTLKLPLIPPKNVVLPGFKIKDVVGFFFINSVGVIVYEQFNMSIVQELVLSGVLCKHYAVLLLQSL